MKYENTSELVIWPYLGLCEIWLKIHKIIKPELKSYPEVQSAYFYHFLVKFESISKLEW